MALLTLIMRLILKIEDLYPDILSSFEMLHLYCPSKKQRAITLSSCEAEYHAMTMAAKQTLWICRVLYKAGFSINIETLIRSDNEIAIDWVAAEQCNSTRAEHAIIQLRFIRDFNRNGTLSLTCLHHFHWMGYIEKSICTIQWKWCRRIH